MQNERTNPNSSGDSPISTKQIPPRERLIFALDVPTVAEAQRLVEQLGESVSFYKLGLQIFMAGGYYEFIEWLRRRQKQVMVDLKFFDVPQTVGAAVAQLKDRGVTYATVHGNDGILRAAVEHQNDVRILAVTVLTSLDQGDLAALGFTCAVKDLVLSRAERALQIGCAGVISSGLEAPLLRQEIDRSLVIITPGIRPVENRPADDQKRTVDVTEAFRNGADYVVVGRPIRTAPDPRAKAEEYQGKIDQLFGTGRDNP